MQLEMHFALITLIPQNLYMNLQKKAGMFISDLKKLIFVPSFHQQTSVELVVGRLRFYLR